MYLFWLPIFSRSRINKLERVYGRYKILDKRYNDDTWYPSGSFSWKELTSVKLVKDYTKTYYKVVNTNNMSAFRGNVKYEPGVWTDAPLGTKLFVFDSLEEAKDFLHMVLGHIGFIYECEIDTSTLVKQRGAKWGADLGRFWDIYQINGKVTEHDMDLTLYPAILTNRVKLIRRIDC